MKVKETHCTVTDLLPNAQYELWVTATNTTGISPASEKALYMTGNKCLLQLRANSSHFLTAEIIVLLFWDVPLKSLSDVFSLFCSLSSLQVIDVPENKVSFLLLFPLCSAVTSSHQAEGVYQLPRGCSDSLGVRKHQPCGLLHRGAQ